MNVTNNILIASTLVILSTSALADDVNYSTQTVKTMDASSKSIAYEQGMATLDSLQVATANQLESKFWWLGMPANNMAVEDGAYITVLEKMDADGQLVYNGVVHLAVSYEADDNEQDSE